ncbi:putative peptidoglycan-binding domain-containing protein [Formosa sp. PL04]|uniref:putative peptidoglycan-binding domain-containing protein n=1 Tax=Formosa sp. PL04 TaxID=3081755 RepID=UPI0029827E2E|nr:putative peptidoglycan-binding domain-containing protein [Formosa sp. PL04]MDW5290833.1 putative peptidoglycan-binding domain-containing protein [Formosa sp. PL04]
MNTRIPHEGIRAVAGEYNLTVDGGMGPNTLNAINSANQMDLYNNLKQTRIDFYNGIVQRNPSQSKFLNGWLNRINKFKDKTEEDNQDVNCPESILS